MKALITRPREDAEGVAQALRQRGLAVQIEPLLRIEPVQGVEIDLGGLQGILATSANGIRSLAAACPVRSLPVYAVGDATARTARALGYEEVHSAGGDVQSLAALVRARTRPGDGDFLHAAGTALAGDLAGMLSQAGYGVRRVVLYRAATATTFSTDMIAALNDNSLDLVLFFSPRTAATFVTLMGHAGLAAACRSITACCLSAAVAKELAPLPWRAVRVAARPEQEALLAVIDEERQ